MSEGLSLKELSERAPQGEWTIEEMPNDAGSRSNAFTSFGIEAEGKTLLDTLNATGMYLEQEPDGDGGYDVWDAQGKAVIEYVLCLVREHRAGRLHTSEDLDSLAADNALLRAANADLAGEEWMDVRETAAYTKGRVEGIGEAVKVAESAVFDSHRAKTPAPWESDPAPYGYEQACEEIALAIRALLHTTGGSDAK